MADMMLTGRVLDAAGGPATRGSRTTWPMRAAAWTRRWSWPARSPTNSPVTNFAVLQALPRIAQASPAEGFLMESLMAAVAGGQRRGQDADAGVPRGPRGEGAASRDRRARPQLLWRAAGGRAGDDPDRATSCLAGARARPGLRDLRRSCTRGRSTTSTGSGRRSGSYFGVRSHAPYEAVLGRRGDAGRAVVPGRDAQLRRARARAARRRRRRRGACIAHSQTRDRDRADLGRAARPGRPGPRRAAAARRRPRRPGRRRTCPTSPRRSSPSSPPRAWARSGRAARRSSARAAWSTGSPRSSPRCCWRSPATATATRTSTAASRWPRSAPGCRPSSTSCTCRTARTTLPDARRLGATCSPSPADARVRAGAVRPPAVRAVLLRHHRAAEGDRARPRRDPAGAPEEPRA